MAATPLPKCGDSGAWLRWNATEWAGMVVAADTLHGYALPATMVHAGAQALLNASLALA